MPFSFYGGEGFNWQVLRIFGITIHPQGEKFDEPSKS
jgi:hypothetical protein